MLYDCSKIKKFHIQYDYWLEYEPHLTSKIRYATRKHVEELILHLDLQYEDGEDEAYTLPIFLFDKASLVKLELVKCFFNYDRVPNWSSLKELKLECSSVYGSDIENVVSGSPVLELLELTRCIGFHNVVIASKSLKRLIFVDVENNPDQLKISCPNLEELSVKLSKDPDICCTELPKQMIENVLSGSHFLHTLELMDCCCSDRLVIASKSLKKLVLGVIYGTLDFEISCPGLEEVNLYGFVPSDFCTTGDFESKSRLKRSLAMQILGQLQHAKLLEIGSWFIKILSALEVKGLSSLLLNCKCLTLYGTSFDKHLPGILCAIRSSPALEKLVIKLQLDQPGGLVNLKDYREKNSWNLNEALFKCSVSNLKTVKIIGLSERDGEHKLAFKFVEFLLENARMLDKIVVILANCGAGFPFDVSKILLSFQGCFPHTTIELLSSTKLIMSKYVEHVYKFY